MPRTVNENPSGVAGTLLILFYIRAVEAQRPDTLISAVRKEHYAYFLASH